MKTREKVNVFTQIRENNEVSLSFLHETPLNCHLTQVLALISENISLNAFLFLHGIHRKASYMIAVNRQRKRLSFSVVIGWCAAVYGRP